ncbi:MAG TPA: phosphoenolpyruvate--protein phosphotransferase [Ktedonobacterales bacterium]|nr:phosphoenolpyruvate--protein phosphotransferase [Ktedonobacterales bacterium]
MTALQTPESSGAVIPGVAASPGAALGPIFLYIPERTQASPDAPKRSSRSAEEERAALQQALAEASAELMTLSAQVGQQMSQDEAGIFEAQAMMLQDPTLSEPAEQLIQSEGLDAATAIARAAEEQARQLEALENEVLAARGADLRDALQRVLRLLHGAAAPDLAEQLAAQRAPVVLVARDLTPSDTARLRQEQVLGICTALGGPTAHAAILARALGIPAVTGVGEAALASLQNGVEVGLDGSRGEIYLTPSPDLRARLLNEMRQQQGDTKQRMTHAAAWRQRSGATADGHPILIAANIGSGGPEEARAAVQTWGAEGVGLLRTEFLLAERPTLPDEQEQYEQYKAIFHAFASQAPTGAPLVVRTLDAGADKPLPALEAVIGEMSEENPALGLRGIRIHLAYPDLLRIQIRALLRAAGAAGVALHLMFPMIATIDEWRQARAIFDAAWQALQQERVLLPAQVPVGIMVETPAAVLLAESLAREAAFFSIGTNDLTQYVLAADRLNGRLGALYNVLQPAVLRAIAQIVQGARAHGRPVAVCGEAAGDSNVAPLLVGLGVEELSMVPASIPLVKEALSRYSTERLVSLAASVLPLDTLEEVRSWLNAAMR